jgi:NAD(P)H-dependent flavin oxidoreductase YrpB (nitropropane dioxygenase family)
MRYADEEGTDVERTCMPAGQGVGGITEILPVAEIMSRMVREAEETIDRLGAL